MFHSVIYRSYEKNQTEGLQHALCGGPRAISSASVWTPFAPIYKIRTTQPYQAN